MEENKTARSVSWVSVRTRRVFVALLTFLVVMVASIPMGEAHTGDQSYLYLDVGDTLAARLQMPFGDLEDTFGLDFDGSDEEIEAVIADSADVLGEYALAHVKLGSGGSDWPIAVSEVRSFEGADYVEVVLDVQHGAAVPQQMTATLDPFFDEVADRDALLLIANDWQRGVVDNEAEHLVRFTPGERTIDFDMGELSSWKNFTASISAGVDHIRTGPDHMLFILALMLPSVLVWRNGWQPVDGFWSSLWRITKIMTMFTLAHSVTFTLTGIGLVPAPGARLTETIIALSIAATAAHTLRPIFGNREWLIAFVFGLFHGFGFASLVQELDVSTGTQLVSLLGRNVGIEIGQLVVVFLTFPALFLLRRTAAYRQVLAIGSVALIVASLGWAIERIFETRPLTTWLVDPLLRFPRVLLLIVAGTVAAGFWFARERAGDRLIAATS